MTKPDNLWNGYALTKREQNFLTALTMREFEKPVSERVTPQDLLSRVFRMYNKGLRKKLR